MSFPPRAATIGVLLSGGLDSAILVSRLLAFGECVQPFYVRSQLIWEAAELSATRQFLQQMAQAALLPLVTLEMPLCDLYGQHWSITGQNVPNAQSPDEAVFLPGRNALLILKAALWCQLHSISRLALAPLGTSPFGDATPEFFAHLQLALNQGSDRPLNIETPFAHLTKFEVLRLGVAAPLETTFSCIDPVGEIHCGRCNKCAERKMAFASVGRPDLTRYAAATNAAS